MYVISVNQNLIETLRLIVQNEPLFAASNEDYLINNNNTISDNLTVKNTVTATALLSDQIEKCEITERIWIVLVAKDWDQNILNTISNISRILMSQTKSNSINEERMNKGRLLIIKKDKSPVDDEFINQHISDVQNEWIDEWKNNIEKCRKLGESRIRTETLAKYEEWILPTEFDYQLIYIDQLDILQQIKQFIGINTEQNILINDAPIIEESYCFSKPPALHWTNYPRNAEVQVSLKFNFPIGIISEPLFRQCLTLIKQSYNWEYKYEWTNGLFLRQQLVKIAIIRAPLNVIEVTGRIDKDEANEEDKDDDLNHDKNKVSKPLERVWPYFAKVFHTILNVIESMKMLPYTLNIVFIGQIFFICPENAHQVDSRSLDLIQTLSAIQRTKSVRFKVKDEPDSIYSLCLEQAFPNFYPVQLCDFQPDIAGKQPKINEKNAKPIFNIGDNVGLLDDSNNLTLGQSFYDLQKNLKSISSSSSSSLINDKNFLNSSNTLTTERSLGPANKKQSRRVSFGAIHAIPIIENNSTASTSKLPTSQLTKNSFSNNQLLQTSTTTESIDSALTEQSNKTNLNNAKSKNNFEIKENENEDEVVQRYIVVNNYIDQILLEAIDDILVED